jgi:hypothetical protein
MYIHHISLIPYNPNFRCQEVVEYVYRSCTIFPSEERGQAFHWVFNSQRIHPPHLASSGGTEITYAGDSGIGRTSRQQVLFSCEAQHCTTLLRCWGAPKAAIISSCPTREGIMRTTNVGFAIATPPSLTRLWPSRPSTNASKQKRRSQ